MTTSYATQSTLGGWFNLSSIKVGRILAAHGLKDRNGATQEALLGGIAKKAVMKDGTSFWVWEAGRISKLIDEALCDVEKPFIDKFTSQVGEALQEARQHRTEGNDYLADLFLDRAFEGVPAGLAHLIRERLGEPPPDQH